GAAAGADPPRSHHSRRGRRGAADHAHPTRRPVRAGVFRDRRCPAEGGPGAKRRMRPTAPATMTSAQINEEIEKFVRPQTFPLGVAMATSGDSSTHKLPRPAGDMGIKLAISQIFPTARRYGWALAVGRDDLSCPLAKTAFGFEEVVPFYAEGNLACGMYT